MIPGFLTSCQLILGWVSYTPLLVISPKKKKNTVLLKKNVQQMPNSFILMRQRFPIGQSQEQSCEPTSIGWNHIWSYFEAEKKIEFSISVHKFLLWK